MRHPLVIRRASHSKIGNILLQRNRNSGVRHSRKNFIRRNIGVVESVLHIIAVQRGWDGEKVGVGFVAEGFVEVESVAGEGEFGGEGGGTVDVVGVALGLRAVEDGRVEGFGDVGEDFGVGADGGDDGG